MSDETAAALHAEAARYERLALDPAISEDQVRSGIPALEEAARAQLAASRPLEEILAEYSPMLDAHSAGEQVDLARLSELMAELGPTRKAQSILDGALPGTLPVITAEQNEGEVA